MGLIKRIKERGMYRQVFKDLKIKPRDIKVERETDEPCEAALYYKYTGKLILKIALGPLFNEYSYEEKKGIVAHEGGHGKLLLSFKNDFEEIKKIYDRDRRFWYLLKTKRLKEGDDSLAWYKADEIKADNYAIEAGYGPNLLQALRKSYKRKGHKLHLLLSKLEEDRISNLEEKLGIKK